MAAGAAGVGGVVGAAGADPGRGSCAAGSRKYPAGTCSDSSGVRGEGPPGEGELEGSRRTPIPQRKTLLPGEMSNLVPGCCGPLRNSWETEEEKGGD